MLKLLRCVRLWRVEAKMHSIAPLFSFACLAFFATAFASHAYSVDSKKEQETMCLAENIYHEARGEAHDVQYVIGMLTLARVKDADREWPKTICGATGQGKQFSWTLDYKLATDRSERKEWERAKAIARDLIANAWTKYVLPSGFECARWYKRTDGKGVSKKSMRFFETRLFPAGTFGNFTAYQERHGCRDPLPTQL